MWAKPQSARHPRAAVQLLVFAALLAAGLGVTCLRAGPSTADQGTPWHRGSTHEHGSDPSKFIGAAYARDLTFGVLASKMGMTEPHEGFKVYVVNDDGHGKAWMIVLHQGTGSPKRAAQAHHSLDLWMVRRRDSALLAEVHLMADFGSAVPDCEGSVPPPASRVLPSNGPGCSHDYEAWTTQLSVGGRLLAPGITFGVDNPTTVIDQSRARRRSAPERRRWDRRRRR